MIPTATPAATRMTLTQDTAQTHADPPIQSRKGVPVAVFEIFKPAYERAIQVHNDRRQTLPVTTPGFGPNAVLELGEALVAGLGGLAQSDTPESRNRLGQWHSRYGFSSDGAKDLSFRKAQGFQSKLIPIDPYQSVLIPRNRATKYLQILSWSLAPSSWPLT